MKTFAKAKGWTMALSAAVLLCTAFMQRAYAQDQDDPPSRVARLGYMEGSVSLLAGRRVRLGGSSSQPPDDNGRPNLGRQRFSRRACEIQGFARANRTACCLVVARARLADINGLDNLIAEPENVALAQKLSDDAITLVRENGKVLPLKAIKKSAVLLPYQAPQAIRNRVVTVIFSDDVRLESGRVFERQVRIRAPDAHIFYVDPRIAGAMSADVLRAVDDAEIVIAAVYAVPAPGVRGSGGAVRPTDLTGILLQGILDHATEKTAVVAVGNPYLARDFLGIQNYLCTFSTASVSETSAVKALFGEVPIRGHLPVSIPGVAQRGAGIERPMQ